MHRSSSSQRLSFVHADVHADRRGRADFEPISHQDPALAPGSKHSLIVQWLVSASCMDLNRGYQHGTSHGSRSGDRTSAQKRPLRESRPSSYSSPLPQNEWADPPSPLSTTYDRPDIAEHLVSPVLEEPLSSRDVRPSPVEQAGEQRRSLWHSLPRRRRRDRDGHEPRLNPLLLHPQMIPYDNRSTYSAPIDLEHGRRTVSQPSTPGYWQEQTPQQRPYFAEPPFGPPPRSPTYPPATNRRRRIQSASNVADATFTDEEEFRLFVQATAGLGPESSQQSGYQPRQTTSEDSPRRHDFYLRHPTNYPTSYEHPTPLPPPASADQTSSPIQETPTTVFALHQLAQLPQASLPHYRQQAALQQQRMSAAMAGVEVWMQSSSSSSSSSSPPPPPPLPPVLSSPRRRGGPQDPLYDGSEDEDQNTDDELPNYAQSQAQAQAARRAEATRRAQELQRRWQQSR